MEEEKLKPCPFCGSETIHRGYADRPLYGNYRECQRCLARISGYDTQKMRIRPGIHGLA
jgi:hypothetical protein